MSMSKSPSPPQPQLAADQDERLVVEWWRSLTERDAHRWEIVLEGKGVRRDFRFKGFKGAWVSLLPIRILSFGIYVGGNRGFRDGLDSSVERNLFSFLF